MSTVYVYFDVGNEDGPTLIVTVGTLVEEPRVQIVVNAYAPRRGVWVEPNQLLQLFAQYEIQNIVEIHDWYDTLNPAELKQKQSYHWPALPINEAASGLLLIVPYCKDPAKYIVPIEQWDNIQAQANILESRGHSEQKQTFLNRIHTYKVEADMYQIITKTALVQFHWVRSDEIIASGDPD